MIEVLDPAVYINPLETEVAEPILTDELIHRAQQEAQAIQDGQETTRQAIEEVVKQVFPVVERGVHKREWNYMAAEEIVPDALAHVIKKGLYERKYQEGNFSGWAYTVARNYTRDAQRDAEQLNEISLDIADVAHKAGSQYATSSAEENFMQNDEKARLANIEALFQAIKMPEKFADVVRLLVQGYTQVEVAKELKIGEGTVQSRSGRGYALIRKHFGIKKHETNAFNIFQMASD